MENKPIADARNELMEKAIASGADFLFTLSDDVIAPGNTIIQLLHRMWEHPEIDILTGVYWTKGYPSFPYIWKGLQRGPYLDWKMGEIFPIEMAGCDCLMVRLSDRVKALGPQWYNTDWLWDKDQPYPSELNTEDFYFYSKARKAGLTLWCDTGVQVLHEDRQSGMLYGLRTDMPQAGGIAPALPSVEGVLQIADLGSGRDTPYFGDVDKVKVTRFDGDSSVRPDYRCDLRRLPVEAQTYDVIHARHVLEHFGREETLSVLGEWLRILKIGGQVRLNVPNLLHAIEWILKMDKGETPPDAYPWWQLYGRHDSEYDYHHNGFTPRRLELLLKRTGCLGDIVVEVVDNGLNLAATATKTSHPIPYAITSEWEEIAQLEQTPVTGLVGDQA